MKTKKINLGFKPSYWEGMPHNSDDVKKKAAAKEAPTVYPQMSVRNEAADGLMDQLKVGDTITATVTFKVTGLEQRGARNSEYGSMNEERSSVDLDVISIEGIEVDGKEAEGDEEESAEGAIDGYMKEKGLGRKK